MSRANLLVSLVLLVILAAPLPNPGAAAVAEPLTCDGEASPWVRSTGGTMCGDLGFASPAGLVFASGRLATDEEGDPAWDGVAFCLQDSACVGAEGPPGPAGPTGPAGPPGPPGNATPPTFMHVWGNNSLVRVPIPDRVDIVLVHKGIAALNIQLPSAADHPGRTILFKGGDPTPNAPDYVHIFTAEGETVDGWMTEFNVQYFQESSHLTSDGELWWWMH